jgi:hypothetical protein
MRHFRPPAWALGALVACAATRPVLDYCLPRQPSAALVTWRHDNDLLCFASATDNKNGVCLPGLRTAGWTILGCLSPDGGWSANPKADSTQVLAWELPAPRRWLVLLGWAALLTGLLGIWFVRRSARGSAGVDSSWPRYAGVGSPTLARMGPRPSPARGRKALLSSVVVANPVPCRRIRADSSEENDMSAAPPPDRQPPGSVGFRAGDRVRVINGTFAGDEGMVLASAYCARYSLVRVVLPIFGRPVHVELEPWQIECIPGRR